MDTVTQWIDDDLSFMGKYPNGVPLLEMVPFYEAVARNEPPKLEWTCPGKRDPKSDEKPEPSVPTSYTNTCKTDSLESQSAAAKLAEFDFDESSNQPFFSSAGVGVTRPLRKVLGPGRHPPRQPRVANMDKILNDLFRSRKDTVSVPVPEPSQRPSAMFPPDRDDNEPPVLVSHDLPTGGAQTNSHTERVDLSVHVGNAVISAEPSAETNVGVVVTTHSSVPVDRHGFTSESHTLVADSVSSIGLPPNGGISSEPFQSELPAQLAHARID
ncbi:hypothetical protein X801_09134 [Opisthorchis viverrini]|uniref:Uncharacterized protein n=2 Tax=Opisthorchis viverrini TaxID=6198 RepID=A0A074ZNB5_OPIVI|nr:hypothetical protein T265_07613 [Opisthorchis viverrini]KER24830.1 hypothetical protein T265_07613 [Opisthorchis viverrini]OON15069.1 hypothetical protein X801_09134 [Opisthorchis viverrini]